MRRELVVTDDIAGEAVRLFREAEPRTLVLAGGETPRATYRRLAREKYRWDEVDVFFGDERCVPPEHPDSNYRMASETLLSLVPARVHRMRGESCDAEAYERELRDLFGELPRFDFLFLGLGADGHTASLFPGDPALDERERWAVRVRRPDHERLTLTLPVLSAARLAVFLVAGAEKREALRRMMAGEEIPASRVAAERVVVLADGAASADRS
ncbi:MAG: 6-phosphogluconolactonase [Dehalococcoidia bacterium]|jgi:6-phosphogluconolactonase